MLLRVLTFPTRTKMVFHIDFETRSKKTLARFRESFVGTQIARSHRMVEGTENFSDESWGKNLSKIGSAAIIGLKILSKYAIFGVQKSHLILHLPSQTRQFLTIVVSVGKCSSLLADNGHA